eukprot:s9_g85.t1
MVLIERTVTKGEKEVLLEEVKKSNAKLKKKQGPNKTKKELAQPAMEISRSLGKAMTEETRQQMVGTLKALAYINAPLILMQLVSMVYRANGDMPMDLDMVELQSAGRAMDGNAAHMKSSSTVPLWIFSPPLGSPSHCAWPVASKEVGSPYLQLCAALGCGLAGPAPVEINGTHWDGGGSAALRTLTKWWLR